MVGANGTYLPCTTPNPGILALLFIQVGLYAEFRSLFYKSRTARPCSKIRCARKAADAAGPIGKSHDDALSKTQGPLDGFPSDWRVFHQGDEPAISSSHSPRQNWCCLDWELSHQPLLLRPIESPKSARRTEETLKAKLAPPPTPV
ncbi:hypothetical protein PG993_012455 [Apiospora rasikravindrae]|uniref:Uncharacterized protein n=1 Tax=Apiospora rasikravindrae TaxID=990691 RepID=A0ABR1S2J6_9PEZI